MKALVHFIGEGFEFTVQTQRFADKNWKDVAWTAAQIKEQQVGDAETVSGKR